MKFLGANWKTTVSGFTTLVTGAIFVRPELVDFVPDPLRGYIVGVSDLLVFISGGTFVHQVKQKNITGGNKQQTMSGALATPGTQGLVDETVKATIKSGEPVTLEQRKAVLL